MLILSPVRPSPSTAANICTSSITSSIKPKLEIAEVKSRAEAIAAIRDTPIEMGRLYRSVAMSRVILELPEFCPIISLRLACQSQASPADGSGT
jgi:hypothetical protein